MASRIRSLLKTADGSGSLSWLVIVMAASTALPATANAGNFDTIRSEVQSSSSSSDDDDDHHHHHYHDDDDDDFGAELLGAFLGGFFEAMISNDDHRTVTYTYDDGTTVTRSASSSSDVEYLFAPYPYAENVNGYMMHPEWVPAPPQTGSGRIWFEFGTNFDELDRWTGKALLEGCSGWGIDGEWSYLTERLGIGQQDNLHVGDVNVMYRLIETEKSQWRLGLGWNWLNSRGHTDGGLNLTSRIDWYPVKPIITGFEFDYGRVGGAEQFHMATSIGVNWRQIEFFTGYDYRKIGPVKLHGPMFGARLWW